ncbi:MAG: A/G-specific adenine glycosylase [Chlamydiia bacterium]
MSFQSDQEALRVWFLQTKRSFPWREEITPYKVLISEVMLQQTRADVVVDYFNRWMRLFPTVESLAGASIDEVLKAFEGLGYYSRARNLHKAAQSLIKEFPNTYEGLLAVEGIGPYTANAILSFAFHKPVIAMDANVQRVLSRYFATHDLKWAKIEAEKKMSQIHSHEIAEGLIELGAVICTKSPACFNCPLQKGCKAFQQNQIEQFPLLKKRKESVTVYKKVLLHHFQGRFGVCRQPKGGLFADLYMFMEESVEGRYPTEPPFKEVRASATCYRFFLFPLVVENIEPIEGVEYLTLDECLKRSFTSGHRKILHQMVKSSEF